MPSVYQDEEEFHAERLTGIGSSEVAAILNCHPYLSSYRLWLDKTGREPIRENKIQLRFGRYAEQFVADEYCLATGKRVQRYNKMMRHSQAPLIAHPDRLVIKDGEKVASYKSEIRTDTGLECKAISPFAIGRDSEWGIAGTDQIPVHYLLQTHACMITSGCPHWDLAALIGNQELRIYHVHHDAELEDYILTEVDSWWQKHVVADTPPDPQSELEAKQRWPRHASGKTLNATVEVGQQLRQLAQIRSDMRTLEAREKAIKDVLYPALADAEVVIYGGEEVATYRANKDGQKVDYQGVAVELMAGMDPADQARVMSAFTRTIPGARVLRLAKALETLQ